MPNSEKDRLAAEVEDRWMDFQDGLSNKRRYPVEQFRAFRDAGKRYAELTRNDPLIHRKVVFFEHAKVHDLVRDIVRIGRCVVVPDA